MNTREAAVATLLRQGWAPQSQVAAGAASPTSVPASPVERQQQQPHPQPPIDICLPDEELTYDYATSPQTPELTAWPIPENSFASGLACDYSLVDYWDSTSLEDTAAVPIASPDSSAPSSSGASPRSLVQSSSSEETVENPESAAAKHNTTPDEEEDIVADAVDDSDLFTPVPPFEMPSFSNTPALATRPTIPPSLHDWILCSEVGLQFMRPARERVISCVACGQDCEDGAGTGAGTGTIDTEHVFRSTFWRMTTCRASHRPPEANHGRSGLCKRCDKDYVLQVIRGEHKCRHAGCRRVLRVHVLDVEDTLWDHPGLWTAFHALIRAHSTYECDIHADTVDSDPHTETDLTPDCDHDRNACGPCLTTLCEAAIQSDRLGDLVCPEPACRKPLNRNSIRDLVSDDALRLYDKKLAFVAMTRNPNFRWCRCGHGQIHAAGDAVPEWTCTACSARQCFVCQDADVGTICEHLRRVDDERALERLRDEHERSRFTSYDMQRQRQLAERAVRTLALEAHENSRGSQLVIATTAKRCPRVGCRVPIQRDEGCGHMTCRRCLTEFCWACKVIWKAPARPGVRGSVFGSYGRRGQGPSSTVLMPLHLPTCRFGSQRTISRDRIDLSEYATGWDVDLGYDEELDSGLWFQDDQQ
ncbi:hypothetical protein HMPREF1624_01196 [Sporothrix schenckii ATCC 58251]|uniref:RING-type domain-containing protein n=1 Tax=Sporothrix schenckii (strain ATCC 58251 / de Perez 2211183) TaxID=1391915 RepID=U7Q506_SPOS1|nr:hypothetical protein HMPREF1624_01196 [Sporothrix schenckii ATCC 58251]